MLATVASEALTGLEGHAVDVEADVVAAAPAFSIVGLPDAAVQESRERVRAAIVNSSFEFPSRRITVNLAPADLRKEGPSFDLPVALALLQATGQVPSDNGARGIAAVGELGLDGGLRPVTGALAVAEGVRRRGFPGLVLPCENAAEAALVPDLGVYPVRDLRGAARRAGGGRQGLRRAPPHPTPPPSSRRRHSGDVDWSDIAGQGQVKRALEVAVAGAHNVLLSGRRARARPCSPGACPGSCRRSRSTRRSPSPGCTASPGSCRRVRRWSCGGRCAPRTTRSRAPALWAAARRRVRAR